MADFNTWLNSLNLNTANARHIDDDADGSFDCVDVPEDWCKYLWPGVSVNTILGYGNAKDLYANSSADYFDKLPANISAQPGDIPVWGATSTNSFGHIAVAISDDGSTISDVEQNTYTQEAATVAHRTHNNLIGFLRPKINLNGGNTMYPNKGDLVNINNETGWPGHAPNDNDVAYWTTGTNNPSWDKGADQVWKDLMYGVITYTQNHPQGSVTKQAVLDYLNGHLQ